MSKRHRHKKRHAADVNSINTTINNNSTPMSIHYQKYVTDTFSYIMNKSKQFSDDNIITGVKFIDQDYHQFNKKKPMK